MSHHTTALRTIFAFVGVTALLFFSPVSFELRGRIPYSFLCKLSASAPTEASTSGKG